MNTGDTVDNDHEVEIKPLVVNTFTLLLILVLVLTLFAVVEKFAPDMKVIIGVVASLFGFAYHFLQNVIYQWSSKWSSKIYRWSLLVPPTIPVSGVMSAVGFLLLVYCTAHCCSLVQGADASNEGWLANNTAYLTPEMALLSQESKPIVHSVLVDSGASTSTFNIRELFTLLTASTVRMLTGDKVLTQASGQGTVHCQAMATSRNDKESPVQLHINALYMPSFVFSLLSVTTLNAQGYDVV